MKKFFLTLALLATLGLTSLAWSQGTCANFAAASCPASVPGNVTHFYFFDYVNGLDSNSGTSESAAWQHMPTCANASNNSAAHTAGAGEGWIFKGAVTVDYHCWPAAIPWGGTSGGSDYIGVDPGWYTGGTWKRPIFSGGGSTGYNANAGAMMSDSGTHPASYFVGDNIEWTGLYWSGTGCTTGGPAFCSYIAWHNFYSGSGSNWELKNNYAHNVTHSGYPTSTDPGNNSALFYMPQDAGSSAHDNVMNNLDGGADCCLAIFTGNEYRNYISGFDNAVFNPNGGETILLLHDLTIVNMVAGFVPSGGPHGNCIHIFGTQANNELVYNNYVNCGQASDEAFEIEEDAATVYGFNNVFTNIVQPNGLNPSSFSGAGHGGTYTLFQNTEECGSDPTPVQECFKLSFQPTITGVNNFGITNNGNASTIGTSAFTGTYSYQPTTFSISCAGGTSNPQLNWGGSQICGPIGSGNGSGYLNIGEPYPFAPMDAAAAASVGTGSAATLASLCATVAGINTPAGVACLSDTTLGVSLNTTNNTVVFPARSPVLRPTAAPMNGAYQFIPPVISSNAGSQVTVVGVFPPMVSTSAYFSTYRSNVLPNINGVTLGVLWAQGNVFGSTDVGIESNTTQGSYSWTGFDTVVEGYSTQTCGANTAQGAAPCKIFFGTGMATSKGLQASGVGNTYTPQYVFGQPWADSSAPTWTSGTQYWAKQDVIYGGTYYQNIGTNGTCTSTGSGGPAADGGCPWTNTGAHAAPQDATFDAIVPPGSNSLWPPTGNAVNINSTNCTNGTSSCPASTVAMGLPVTFETPVYAGYTPFMAAFFAHLAAAPYASQVVFVRSGIGQELDENFIWSIGTVEPLSGGNITAMGNTWLALHATFTKTFLALRNANFPSVGLNMTVNGGVGIQPYAWATQEAADAVSIGAGLGCECLSLTDVAAYWSGTNCTNNWCSAFQTYGNQAPFLELQEEQPSNPGGASGTLDQFLPFGAQMRMNKPLYVEIIASDLECAYISTYTGSNCTSAPSLPFQQTIQNLSFGVPPPLNSGLQPRSH
jgi:hypothetical protein